MDDSVSKEFGRRVSVMRRSNKMTLDRLAERSGVSRSMLSQIERGKANPTLIVAARIAEAFGLSITHLIDDKSRPPLIEIVKQDSESSIFSDTDGCQVKTLNPLHLEKDTEFYMLTFKSGAKLNSAAHYNGTREMLTVASGSVELSVGNEPSATLSIGDTAHYPADRDHCIANRDRKDAVCYLVVTYA